MLALLIFIASLSAGASFTSTASLHCRTSSSTTSSIFAGSPIVELSNFPPAVSFTITTGAPLGVILSEFQSQSVSQLTPVTVVDVEIGQNAAKLGVRDGDVLIGIDGESVLVEGIGFDSIMEKIGEKFASPDGKITATFFRGSGFGREEGFDSLVGTIVNGGNAEEVVDEVEDVIPDEGEDLNIYDLYEDGELPSNKISISKVFNNIKEEFFTQKPQEEKKEEKEKKSGGFFGGLFSQETIQLEDDPNEYANSVDDERRDDN